MSQHIVLAGPAAETTRLIAYWILAILAVAAALGMILARRAVHCALMLAVVMLSLAVMYAMLGRAVPGLRAGHRLHRRGADAVPVRAHDRRHHRRRLDHRDAPRPAAVGGHRRHRAADPAGARRRQRGDRPGGEEHRAVRQQQRDRPGAPDLHQVRLPVRAHQRAAHHRRARRDGARAPRADRAQAHPAGAGPAASRQRPAHPAARPGHLCAAQCRRHAGPAARRQPVPDCRSATSWHRPRRRRSPAVTPLPPGPADSDDPAGPDDLAGTATTAGVAGGSAGASSAHGGQEAGDQW